MARRYYHRRRRQAGPEELYIAGGIVIALAIGALAYQANSSGDAPSPTQLLIAASSLGLITIGVLFTLAFWRERARRQGVLLLTMADVDLMPGVAFEQYVAELFRTQGYGIKMTPASGDYGVDIILSKDGQRTAVQVKRYSKPVRQAAIREAIAGMAFYKCSRAMVVTNSTFTKAALALARVNNCALIDREALGRLAMQAQVDSQLTAKKYS